MGPTKYEPLHDLVLGFNLDCHEILQAYLNAHHGHGSQ